MLKKLFYVGLLGALVGGFVAYRMWTKPHATLDSRKVDMTITAAALSAAFGRNSDAADSTFSNKVLHISGKVAKVQSDSLGKMTSFELVSADSSIVLTCKTGLSGLSEHKMPLYQAGQSVEVKCECFGNLMGEVQLSGCLPIKK